MAKNVIFVRGNTATINGTAITDGQLLYDTTTGQHYIDVGSTRKKVGNTVDTILSTTSTNPIANNAITTSIVNTTAEVSAITADNIPCGTKPVKELNKNFIRAIDDLTEKYVSIASGLTLCRLGDKRTLVFKDFIIPNDGLNIFKLPENDCPKNGSYFPIGITNVGCGIIGYYDDNTWRSWNVDLSINVTGRVNGTIIWYI